MAWIYWGQNPGPEFCSLRGFLASLNIAAEPLRWDRALEIASGRFQLILVEAGAERPKSLVCDVRALRDQTPVPLVVLLHRGIHETSAAILRAGADAVYPMGESQPVICARIAALWRRWQWERQVGG